MNGEPLTTADLLRYAEEFPTARDPLRLPDLGQITVSDGYTLRNDDLLRFKITMDLNLRPFTLAMGQVSDALGHLSRQMAWTHTFHFRLSSRSKRRRDAAHRRSPHRRRRHGRA